MITFEFYSPEHKFSPPREITVAEAKGYLDERPYSSEVEIEDIVYLSGVHNCVYSFHAERGIVRIGPPTWLNCLVCGTKFFTLNDSQKFCTHECSTIHFDRQFEEDDES